MRVRLQWVLGLAMVAAIAVAPAAQATLVFVRNPLRPVVWSAADDGSGARRVASGSSPRVSPDGQAIAYLQVKQGGEYRGDLMVVPADGGARPRRLVGGFEEPLVFAWSPDSSMIAAAVGPSRGLKRLVLIDIASGARRTVARGSFSGVSFSPEGGQLVYARAPGEGKLLLRSDVYRVGLTGGAPVRLTHDHHSLSPLWGPGGRIVFVKQLGAKRRRYFAKNELYLMGPGGGDVQRLTDTRVKALLWGLTPTEWSANGRRLLTEFEGQDTSYAVTVNPQTGAQRVVGGSTPSEWFMGGGLSADGSTILGSTGGFQPGRHNDVVSVPYTGGRVTVLARNAFEPDWSR